MEKFLKLNLAIIRFLSMGLIKIKLPTNNITSIVDLPEKLLSPTQKQLLSFAKETQYLPKGCEALNELQNITLCDLLESVDLKNGEIFTLEQQQNFYINFIKLICIQLTCEDIHQESDTIHYIQTKIIPAITIMLLQHNSSVFLRTYNMIDACFVKMIDIDKLEPYFIKYHNKGF